MSAFSLRNIARRWIAPRGATTTAPSHRPPASIAPLSATRGDLFYLEVLKAAHRILAPSLYLEIGVEFGGSLRLAQGRAVGVDPQRQPNLRLPETTTLAEMTSDDFFAGPADELLTRPPELVFIDGLHLFENVLRDFINVERRSGPGTVVVIDDIFPNNPAQATRQRRSQVWMGDVWRLLPCLQRERPDLFLLPIDASPAGLLLVAGLDPANRTLEQHYDRLTAGAPAGEPPASVLGREGAVSAQESLIAETFTLLRAARDQGASPAATLARLHEAREAARNRVVTPRLSLVVIAYNMPRELPRTLWSLSPALQRGIRTDDYEIIVIDNGSTIPFDEAECRRNGGHMQFLSMPNPTPSPVAAINLGLARAKGDLIGVFIDGARLASPGMLAGALDAAKLHRRPVIGTLSFELGPDFQSNTARFGYDRQAEDELLRVTQWMVNPYRLFDIASLGASTIGGWFSPLAETNALFMTAAQWRELGGYDEIFQLPGGGFANLDMWQRAVTQPDSQTVILLGEGTFHQTHDRASNDRVREFSAQYERIRGHRYESPRVAPLFVGGMPPQALPVIEYSANLFRGGQGVWHGHRASAQVSAVGKRSFRSALSPLAMTTINRKVFQSRYRGRQFYKSPLDIGLYIQLVERLQPRTVIEIGTKEGGSALWFADLLSAHGIDGRIVSVDIEPPTGIADPRIAFIKGDAGNLGRSLAGDYLAALPRPWLVVEDSSHRYVHSLAVLEFFHPLLNAGDYIVVEDGALSQFFGANFAAYRDGPNRAIAAFLKRYSDSYEIDASLCDFYGYNVTSNPNGWLRRL